jgi:hypothetical protein
MLMPLAISSAASPMHLAIRIPHDSEFWSQWVRCGLQGCWEHGLRSFPLILQFFSQPIKAVISQLQSHNNPSSARLADFLHGGSHNAETVMASILGALTSLLAQSALQVLGSSELELNTFFRRPVCLHIEISEPQLETHRPLIQMLARCVIDALISAAEYCGAKRVPATVFFDDMPSLGYLLSVERLLTLRSRSVGIVAGVQSINSLELAVWSCLSITPGSVCPQDRASRLCSTRCRLLFTRQRRNICRITHV